MVFWPYLYQGQGPGRGSHVVTAWPEILSNCILYISDIIVY